MNIFTKLVVIFVFLLSVVYLGFTAVLFTGRQNYKDQLRTKITATDTMIKAKDNEIAKDNGIIESLKQAIAISQTALAASESEKTRSFNDLKERQSDSAECERKIAELGQENDVLNSAIRDANNENGDLLSEMEKARQLYESAQHDVNILSAAIIDARNDLAQVKKNLVAMDSQYIELSRKVAAAEQLKIYYEKLNVEAPIEVPKNIQGKVLAVSEGRLILISPGKNSGVKAGTMFTVSRDGKFIAKIKVDKVDENNSTAEPVEGMVKELIKEQDDITTSPYQK